MPTQTTSTGVRTAMTGIQDNRTYRRVSRQRSWTENGSNGFTHIVGANPQGSALRENRCIQPMNNPIQADVAMVRFDCEFSIAGSVLDAARIVAAVASQFIDRCQL